jgi:hypothetical protein
MKNKMILGTMVALLVAATGCAKDDSGRVDAISQTEQAAKPAVYKSKWKGGNVSAFSYTETGSQNFYAWENKDGNTRTTYLEFYSYDQDPDSLVCEMEEVCWWDENGVEICEDYEYCYYADYTYRYGYGEIPSSAFSVGKKTAKLNVSLEDLPNFQSYECSTTSPDCVPVTGDISLAFAANGDYASSSHGTNSYTYTFDGYSYTSKSTGQSSSRSAKVTGSAFGVLLENATGDISESKGSGVTKEIYRD